MSRCAKVAVFSAFSVLATACGGGGSSSSPPTTPGGGTVPFTIETADSLSSDTGWFPSLAVDYLGTVHVSYLDRANKKFRYARRAGGAWTRSDVASAGTSGYSTFGKFSGVAIDSAGVPAVSYHDADVSFVYAKGNAAGTAWTKTLIPSPGTAYAFQGHNAIAIDPSTDAAHVVNWDYKSTSPIETLGYWTPGGSKIAVSGPPDATGALHHGVDCVVAVDARGWPQIAYTSWNGQAAPSAKNFVTWAEATGPAAWTLRNVEENARGWTAVYEEKWIAIAMDGSNRPHLAYYKAGLDRIRYATWSGSAWTLETVAQPSLNLSALVSVAIAVDGAGNPHVAYYGLGSKVTYAKRTGPGTWTTQVVDASANDTGHGVAIGVDPAGHVHIAYRDDTAKTLKYARR